MSEKSFELPVLHYSLEVAEDLSAAQHFGGKLDANGLLVLCDTLGESCLGPISGKPLLGDHDDVMVIGIAKVKLGATVAADAAITVNALGKFITAATGHEIFGRLLFPGVVDDIVAALITREGVSA